MNVCPFPVRLRSLWHTFHKRKRPSAGDDKGHHGKLTMDSVKFGVVPPFPGPLHQGHGTVQPFVDLRASPAQRAAVLAILSGKAGNRWFEVVASLVEALLPPAFVPVHFEHDIKKRRAKVSVAGLIETIT